MTISDAYARLLNCTYSCQNLEEKHFLSLVGKQTSPRTHARWYRVLSTITYLVKQNQETTRKSLHISSAAENNRAGILFDTGIVNANQYRLVINNSTKTLK